MLFPAALTNVAALGGGAVPPVTGQALKFNVTTNSQYVPLVFRR